ncbi:MAG TPA: tetratricopeptide repeat protein, partial [Chloroflexota bacterium]|nr:tetratricopeptide repeat protein [Chloroflexota bacterium]
VALSGDGGLLASGGEDGSVRIWEAPSGRALATLQGHTGGVYGVALSGDGGLLASGGEDGSVRIWEAPSGRALATLHGHSGTLWAVALSADGALVASGSIDGTVRLWEASSGTSLGILRAERSYERLDVTGLTGVTEAQRAALLALGAVEQVSTDDAQHTSAGAAVAPVRTPTHQAVVVPPSTRPRTNLPPARTTFIGRAADLAALTQALDPDARAGMRLVTLTGVAGSGKTRLALAAAEAVRDAYRDGIWLVDLSPLPVSAGVDLAPVGAAMLAALGLQEQPGQTTMDILIDHLQRRRMLLLLDNCEHVVVASAALAARLLGACPELQILATSQQSLGVAEEIVWPVAPLALPPQPAQALVEDEVHLLEQSDAVRLFVERARAVRPGFTLNTATATQVVAICRRLNGLPLAIELAAARLNVLPLEEILARLDDRFRLLRRGGRGAADRHQALQATLDWSYGLFQPAEQALLRRLAVFAGGWDVVAAEAVCAGRLGGSGPVSMRDQERPGGSHPVAKPALPVVDDTGDQMRLGGSNPVHTRDQGEEVAAEAVLELLDELLEWSLLYVDETDGTPRYGMLETVRQYGLLQLERTGEIAMVRDRHLQWCATLAEQAAPALQGPEQAVWLARLERELDNLRAALQWALDRGLSTLGLRVAGGPWQFWVSRGHRSEGRRWLAALLALAADDDDASMAVRASALEGAAWLAEDAFDFAQASTLFAQSSALRRAVGQEERMAAQLISAAVGARAGGDYARATALLEQSLAQHRALGNRHGITYAGLGLSLSDLALVLSEQGEYAQAIALNEECLALSRELGDQEGVGRALLGLGDIARAQGDAGRVRAYCEEGLAIFRELGLKWAIGFALNNLALAAYMDGDLALAALHAEESESIFRGIEAGPSLAEALVTMGRIRAALGEAVGARAILAEALSLAWTKGPRVVVAAALEEIAVQAVQQGEAQHGAQLLGGAALLRQSMGAPVRPADRPAIKGALAAARASLGDTAFADAWATGQTLPLERVVAYALTGPSDASGGAEPASGR